uniref:Uncharacterized protein n=3 Tax=Caenorhabditis japonica TaxID=281687 RepID=A0A8R1E6R6_CAEJA
MNCMSTVGWSRHDFDTQRDICKNTPLLGKVSAQLKLANDFRQLEKKCCLAVIEGLADDKSDQQSDKDKRDMTPDELSVLKNLRKKVFEANREAGEIRFYIRDLEIVQSPTPRPLPTSSNVRVAPADLEKMPTILSSPTSIVDDVVVSTAVEVILSANATELFENEESQVQLTSFLRSPVQVAAEEPDNSTIDLCTTEVCTDYSDGSIGHVQEDISFSDVEEVTRVSEAFQKSKKKNKGILEKFQNTNFVEKTAQVCGRRMRGFPIEE